LARLAEHGGLVHESVPLAARLERGDRLVGTFLQVPSLVTAEVVAGLGLDFVCVEGEHSGMSRESVQLLVTGASSGGTPVLVRVADNTIVEIAGALDAGATGVIVPRVDSGAEAAAVVRAGRYPPRGARGLGPGRATAYGRSVPEYFGRADAETVVAVQIESTASVQDAGPISGVEGLDLVFVGPGDLAVSMGVPFGDERVTEAALSVLAAARAAGRPGGIWAPSAEAARRWLDAGFQVVIVGSELAFLADGVERLVADLR
jgi:4-hydroxy-2-oxoheptanedioate aldolase